MYYKFEERNSCPQCGGALSHVGSVTEVLNPYTDTYLEVRRRYHVGIYAIMG